MTLTVLLLVGAVQTVVAKKEKTKKTVVTTTVADRLSYNDRMRYNYFFLEAVRQQEAGHYAAAYDLLTHCLQIDPQAAEAYYMQARFLSAMQQDSLALQNLEKAASLRPGNDAYQEKVAQFYIGLGNYDKATQAYERLYESDHSNSDVLNVLVQLYKQQKDYDKMLWAIDKMEQDEGANEQFALARMNVYELKGDAKNAYKTLKQLADSHPNDVIYGIMLGNWLMQHKKQKEAYKLFAKALKENPDNTYAQSSMYDYYRAAGQDSLARQMMDRILLGKNTPDDSRLQFFRQAIQENEASGGDSTQILRLIDRMQQASPHDANIAQMKAAYYSLKKMPQAEVDSALVDLLQLAPDNGSARFQLIQDKWPSEDWKAIEQLAAPGMLYNPDEMAFYYFTGLARYYQKNDKGALDAFQRGTAEINDKSDPNIVSDFYAIMGEIYHNMGENDKAFAAFDSCLQWKPDHVMTLNNYAYFLTLQGGDLKKAETMSAQAIKAEPTNATYLDTYAWVLYKEGRYAEAKIYIDQTLKNDTDTAVSPEVLEHAADIYMKAGQRQKAIDFLEQAVKAGGDKEALTKKQKLYIKEKE